MRGHNAPPSACLAGEVARNVSKRSLEDAKAASFLMRKFFGKGIT